MENDSMVKPIPKHTFYRNKLVTLSNRVLDCEKKTLLVALHKVPSTKQLGNVIHYSIDHIL